MGNLAKDTTEMDLWAFDDVDPQGEPPPQVVAKPAKTIPVPRETGETPTPSNSGAGIPRQDAGNGDSGNVSLNRKGKSSRPLKSPLNQAPASGHSKPGTDFDDLDGWDETEPVEEPVKVTREKTPAAKVEPVKPEPVPEPESLDVPAPASTAPADEREEFSSKAKTDQAEISIRPKLNLTKVEQIGLVALVVIILIASGVFYFNTISRLPTGAERVEAKDFPIQGGKVSVTSAVTFWRTPIISGANADTVRRDALLIPVVNLVTSGGPAAIRVFFRNSDGELVGDAVSRTVRGEGMKFQLSATDGFSDMGMHAAYRTGQSKPWTIEVLEAPSEDSPTTAFKKLFEMNIASDRR